MGLDIRLPIGLLFSIFGLLLIGYGALGDKSIYARSLDVQYQSVVGPHHAWILGGDVCMGQAWDEDEGIAVAPPFVRKWLWPLPKGLYG